VTVGDQTVTVTQLAHDQTPTDDVVVYYHTDAIGSVRLVTDANGAAVRSHDFLPFGQDTPAGPNDTESFLFAGHEREGGAGTDYFGARFYPSFTERFATPDPLWITDERVGEPYRLNRYAYAHNNPLRFVDPSGWIQSVRK
jgi:RHS repeat-associated protein